MGPDLDTLATTLYVTVDDLLIQYPEWAPQRPAVPRWGSLPSCPTPSWSPWR